MTRLDSAQLRNPSQSTIRYRQKRRDLNSGDDKRSRNDQASAYDVTSQSEKASCARLGKSAGRLAEWKMIGRD